MTLNLTPTSSFHLNSYELAITKKDGLLFLLSDNDDLLF